MKYPEVYFSKELSEFKKNKIEILVNHKFPKIKELPPTEPIKPAEPTNFSFKIFLTPVIFTFLAFLLSKFNITITVITYFVVLIAVLIYFISSNSDLKTASSNYPKLKDEFEKEIEDYNIKISIQRQQRAFYELSGEFNENFSKDVNEYIKKVILPKTWKANQKFANPRKGKTEDFFIKELEYYFGNSIKTDFVIEIFHYKDDVHFASKEPNAYCPDIIFEHKLTDLCIDIEIDEPYNENGALHTISDVKDYERNKYFIERGWVIIRFSEEQIKNEPKSCCKEIAKIIALITGDKSFINQFKNINDLYRHRKWNFDDIPKLREKNYRNLINARIEDLL